MATIVLRNTKGSPLTNAEVDANFTNLNNELGTKANTASPTFTGTPAAPTPTLDINSTQIATTAFVQGLTNGLLTKSVAGGATVALTAAEVGNKILKFTGALTANISVTIPDASLGNWFVMNTTTGAFTLTLKGVTGTGVVCPQNKNVSVIKDGVNVSWANTAADSVAFTGTNTAPTATLDTNTTQLATTAFVQSLTNGLLTKSVAGGATVALTAAECGNKILKLTGAITANISVTIPDASLGNWFVINSTTGAFTVTVKGVTGTGVVVPQTKTVSIIKENANVTMGNNSLDAVRLTGTTDVQGQVSVNDNILLAPYMQDVSWVRVNKGSVGTGTVTFDFTGGNYQELTVTGALTIAYSNWPATGRFGDMLTRLNNAGSAAVTLPTINYIKPDGTTTTTFSDYMTALGRSGFQASGVDFLYVWTDTAGTTLYGKVL